MIANLRKFGGFHREEDYVGAPGVGFQERSRLQANVSDHLTCPKWTLQFSI